jgi:hypothetical protein
LYAGRNDGLTTHRPRAEIWVTEIYSDSYTMHYIIREISLTSRAIGSRGGRETRGRSPHPKDQLSVRLLGWLLRAVTAGRPLCHRAQSQHANNNHYDDDDDDDGRLDHDDDSDRHNAGAFGLTSLSLFDGRWSVKHSCGAVVAATVAVAVPPTHPATTTCAAERRRRCHLQQQAARNGRTPSPSSRSVSYPSSAAPRSLASPSATS